MKKILRVAGCILEYDNKILLLYRTEKETDPSLWGIPAGKIDAGESDLEAVVREVQEETCIRLAPESLESLGTLPIDYGHMLVEFSLFHIKLDVQPVIKLSPREHIKYEWIKPKDALNLPDLMKDVDAILEKFVIKQLGIG